MTDRTKRAGAPDNARSATSKRNDEQPGSKNDKEQPGDRFARSSANAAWWSAFFAFVITGATITQAWFTQGQLAEMRESGEDTKESVAAYKETVEIMKSGAALAKRQLKAHVSASWATVTSYEAGRPIEAIVAFENSGQGVARIEARTTLILIRDPIKTPSIPGAERPVYFYVGPSAVVRRRVWTTPITEEQADLLRDGTLAMVLYGDLIQTDEAKVRTLCEFRLYYRGGAMSEPHKMDLLPTGDGNDECKQL